MYSFYDSKQNDYTILDCIYHEMSDTFYVLDLMCWKQQPFYDAPTSFRFFWLQSKFDDELMHLNKISKYNKYKFILLEEMDCNMTNVAKCKSAPFSSLYTNADTTTTAPLAYMAGIVFYHKESLYERGMCPLTLWLQQSKICELFP